MSKKVKPLKQGAVVTGYSDTGLFGLPGHTGHLFRLHESATKAKFSNSGYKQTVRCIVCRTLFENVDCEFLLIKADLARIEQCQFVVRRQQRNLTKAERELDRLERNL